MNRIRLALFALLVVSIGACGGRSALKPLGDGGGTNDVGATLDGKRDTAIPDVKADATTPADGVRDTVAPDIGGLDRPLSDVAPDLANLDGPGVADARDAGTGVDSRDSAIIDTKPDGGNDLGDTAPTLSSIGVTPPSPTIVVGVPYTGLVVTALFSDGTSSDVTASSAFVSSDTTIVQVSGHTLSGLKAGSATITVTYSGMTSTATVTVSSSPLKSLSIDSVVPIPVGQFILVTATGVLADGTKVDVTAQATWVSSDTTLATVALDATTAKERITGIKAGVLTVTATVQGISASAAVTVTASPMTRIDITPVQPILQRGVSQPFQATATFADGTTGDVTQQATWTTSDAAVATVTSGATGVVVKAVAVGAATISATVGTIKGSTTVTVTAPTLLSIAVAPASWLPNVGGTQSFTATGTFSDDTTADLTVSATWSSSSPASFSISNAAGQKGQATALAVGAGVVQASFAGVIGTAKVAVTSSPLVAIKVTPNPLAIVLGLKGSLLATGVYQNGTTQDITTQVAWTVADGTIAGVSNVAATAGQVSGVGIGTTTVTATLTGISGQTTVTVSQAKLVSITVTPATANVTAGVAQQFTATGNYDNGATPDLTTQVTWTSSNIGVAQVSNAAGSNGLASSLVAGTATITATLTGVSGTAALTVAAPLLSSIMVAPASASIEVGTTQAFTVTAVYQNGTTAPVLGAWTSSDLSVATVLPATGRRTLATAVAAGTTTITVTFQGQTDTALLAVTAVPTLVGLTVTPQNPATILVGATQQFQANAIMSDGSSTVVTGAATWTTSDATVASVSNGGGPGPGGGGRGLATGIGAGTATITATYRGQTATATLSVRNPTPTGLIINPATAAIRVNGTQQFQALVTLDDGTTQTVTNAASWTTSDGTIASITTGGGPGGGGRGLATGVAAGTVTITATDNGFTAKATLTVSAATPVDLVVTPAAPKIVIGAAQAFVATLVFDDNTTAVVTGQATWSSSDPTVATVTTAGGGPFGGGGGGVATAAGDGTTTITAKFDGLSGTAVLTVTDPPISFVQVTPTNPNIPVQGAVQFTATAVFTDNSTRNVTGQATWSASDSAVAVVANSGATIGRATGLGSGTATITATYQGTSGSSQLTVAQSVLSIAVTPTNPTTVLGIPVLFSATATLSNNATLVVTGDSSWVSSDSTVATVNAAGGAVPEKAGTTSVTATYLGVSGSSTLTVSSATLSSIGITPNPVSMANGASLQLTATGTYSDASTHDLTSVATWLSSSPGAASVSNANGSRGLLTATGSGTTSVTAVFQGVTSATDTITVTP